MPVSPAQPINAELPMLFADAGMVKFVNPLQLRNADCPIVVRLPGNVTPVKPAQFSKACLAIRATPDGIT